MGRLPAVRISSVCVPVALAAAAFLLSCSKHPEVEDFKQIQLQWNAHDDAAEQSGAKDDCVIDITSKIMRAPAVVASKLVEISYEVEYHVLGNGLLVFDGRCSDSRFSDLHECSGQATCGVGSTSVVKFHNER